jgi:hypothetical protein
VEFVRFRNWILIAPILGLTSGAVLGSALGNLSSAGWGDLVIAIFGVWLGGPLGALLAFQVLIGRFEVDLNRTTARIANLALTFFAIMVILAVLSIAARIGIVTFLLFPVLISFNLLLSYFNLVASIRVSRK